MRGRSWLRLISNWRDCFGKPESRCSWPRIKLTRTSSRHWQMTFTVSVSARSLRYPRNMDAESTTCWMQSSWRFRQKIPPQRTQKPQREKPQRENQQNEIRQRVPHPSRVLFGRVGMLIHNYPAQRNIANRSRSLKDRGVARNRWGRPTTESLLLTTKLKTWRPRLPPKSASLSLAIPMSVSPRC